MHTPPQPARAQESDPTSAIFLRIGVVVRLTIQVRDTSPFGETRGAIILPLQSVTFSFSRFGTEPMSWNFDVATVSDAFVVT